MIGIIEEPPHLLPHRGLDRLWDFKADRLFQPHHRIPPAADIVSRPPFLQARPVVRADAEFPIGEIVVLGVEYRQQVLTRQAERLL